MTIKIIHYLGSLNFGGIERLVLDLVTEQKKNPQLCPSIMTGKKEGEFLEKFLKLDVEIYNLNYSSGYDFNPIKLLNIYSLIKNYSIIHLHSFNIFVSIAAVLANRKIIYTEHGNFAFGREKTISDRINHFFRKIFFNYIFNITICNSTFTFNYLNQKWDIDRKFLKTIHNGSKIDVQITRPPLLELGKKLKNKFVVGTVSRLAKVKRIDRLIEAYNKFSVGKNDVYLIIVGDGTERSNLESLSKQNSDRIIFTGYVSNPIEYNMIFNICVFPSQNESFGLVAIEAYSLRKPVMVFQDGGGLTEIVNMCDPNDIVNNIDGLIERLEYYYENKNKSKNVMNVLNYFNSQRMENEYYKLYMDILCAE